MLSIILLDIGLRIIFFIKDGIDRHSQVIMSSLQKNVSNYKKVSKDNGRWIDDLFIELNKAENFEFYPFIIWLKKEFHGKYVNVSSKGVRKTWNSYQRDNGTKKIFCFGGSTMWGIVTRDNYTIPSLLSKELYKNGYRNYYIENLSETAYTSTHELIYLVLKLKEGDIPDYVIFYDGINEVYPVDQPGGEVGTICNLEEIRHKFSRKEISDLQMFNRGLNALIEDKSGLVRVIKLIRDKHRYSKKKDTKKIYDREEISILAEKIIHKYLENIAFVDRLAKIYGFKYKFFWQPVLYCFKPLSPSELELVKLQSGKLGELYKETYSILNLKKDLPENFVNISDTFSQTEKAIYVDFCHTIEKGNEIIAKEIFNKIKEDL